MKITPHKRVVLSTELVQHPLWNGSTLEIAFNQDWLTIEMIQQKIARSWLCDDLTPEEKSLQTLLENVLLDPDNAHLLGANA